MASAQGVSNRFTFASMPRTERGQPIVMDKDPKGETFLYCHGNSVIISSQEEMKEKNRSASKVQTPHESKRLNGIISQAMFSSYNDSDSNATLRFNRHASRMSVGSAHGEKKNNGYINLQDKSSK